jgi:deazaflavin-dependent oxidoreductase (nitroreductase family)
VLVETTGRKTGLTRRTPLALGRRDDSGVWVIAVHGRGAAWLRNAEAAGEVRLRHRARWLRAHAVVHEWRPDLVATMSAYARSGPRLTADNPLLVQFVPVAAATGAAGQTTA